MNDQITTQNPFALTTMQDVEQMAKWISESGCFGIKTPAQAITLMLMAHEEGKTLSKLLKEVHVFDTGKLSQRADYTQSVFEKTGTILWHVRTPDMVAGSFFKIRPIDDAMRARAMKRFELQWQLDALQNLPERDGSKEGKLIMELSKLAYDGEVTIIRTMLEAERMGVDSKTNYKLGGMNMLQWRCVTDGVKLIDPAVLSGLASDVELTDLKNFEQASLTQRASAPQSNDIEAMQAILARHEEDALAALQRGNEREVKRYQGLAADMRIVIQEAWDKEKPAKVDFTEQNRATVDGAIQKALKLKQLHELADDVPMTHASDLVHRGPAASVTLPPVTLEAKVDQVEPPKKETRRVPEKPADPEPTETKPAIGSNDPLVTELSKWADYRVHLTVSTAFHKKLSEFSTAEIAVLYKKRSLPFLNSEDPALKLEAEMIRQAHDSK